MTGFEPATFGSTDRYSTVELHSPYCDCYFTVMTALSQERGAISPCIPSIPKQPFMSHSPVRYLTGIRTLLTQNVRLGLWPQTETFYPLKMGMFGSLDHERLFIYKNAWQRSRSGRSKQSPERLEFHPM